MDYVKTTKMNYNLQVGYGQIAGQFPFTGSGKVFFVGDSGTANREMLQSLFINDPDGEVRFFSTIDAAVSACTANAGDIVYVAPGHTENIASATSLALDVAGVRIIGLGQGEDRPTLTYITSTAATIDVTAANVSMENMIIDLTGDTTGVLIGIDVSAADFTFKNNRVILADSSVIAVKGLFADTSSDGLVVTGNEFIGSNDLGVASGLLAAIEVEGVNVTNQNDSTHVRSAVITDNTIIGAFDHTSGSPILMDTWLTTNIEVSGNFIENFSLSSYFGLKGTHNMSGRVSGNLFKSTNSVGTVWVHGTPGTTNAAGAKTRLTLIQNYGVNVDGERGIEFGIATE